MGFRVFTIQDTPYQLQAIPLQSSHAVPVSSMQWTTNSFLATLELIKQGVGWAYLPTHLVEAPIKNRELHPLPMRLDDKPWCMPVDRVTPKNQAMGPAMSWLSDALTDLLD